MRPRGERSQAGRGICTAILSLAAALTLSCCGSPGPPAPAATPHVTSTPSRARPWTFAVSGDHPVPTNGSQDTHAATPAAVCDRAEFSKYMSTGRHVADGFTLAGFPAAAALLDHFLDGKGTAVGYRAGSAVSKQAQASSAFRAVNKQVQAEILHQLKAGQARVRLSAAQLPLVAFGSVGSDLYWGFRGTQGLTVTGTGTRRDGRYAGTLSYVIRDSYGFPAGDTLAGFGPPMRYLQTVCGAPRQDGGAHWFPDTITVTVPFRPPVPG
ncbi:MAG TPA: hypothetical protein VGM53_16240 [Streptosporangiaceae bacterium]